MTEKQFAQLVRRLEVYARHYPAQYKIKVALVAMMGYAYTLMVLGLVVALALACFFFINDGSSAKAVLLKIGIGLTVLATVIVRALWVRLTPPTGIEIRREEAPRLFLLIDKLTEALGTPRFHHVLIVNDFNAAVVQTPRLGAFGWYRNYLLIGMPLMLSTTPRQFRAVLAHEFGHLGRQHGRFSSWIYRARVTWGRLLDELNSRNHWASVVFTPFLRWYAPFFNGYSFVLARAQEYEADRNAARLVGSNCMKDALASIAVGGRLLHECFWPALDRRTLNDPAPPTSHLTELAETVTGPIFRGRIRTYFDQEMNVQTGYADTHPSLADRIEALSRLPIKKSSDNGPFSLPHLIEASEVDAAHHYLDSLFPEIRDRIEREWVQAIHASWKQNHEKKLQAETRRRTLSQQAALGTLTPAQMCEYAELVEWLDGEEAAIPLLQQLVGIVPAHAPGNFALGRLLLNRGERHGIALLELAMKEDGSFLLPACQLAEHFLERAGQHKEAGMYRERAADGRELIVKAEEERRRVTPQDTYIPHDLPEDTVRTIAGQLAAIPTIAEVHLSRKRVTTLPQMPAYVLIVVPRYRWYEWSEEAKNQALLARITQDILLPSGTYVLVLGSAMKRAWRKTLKRIPALPISGQSSPPRSREDHAMSMAGVAPFTQRTWLQWLPRHYLAIIAVALGLAIYSNVSSHPTPNCIDQSQAAGTRFIGRGKVYFVPVGDIPAATVAEVAQYYSKTWNIPLETMPSLQLDESLWNLDRNQLIAERITLKMQRSYPVLSQNPEAIIIGLTAADMYLEQSSGRYTFSLREGGRYAVVSSARMHPRMLPLHVPHGSFLQLDERDDELMRCRLRKMVGKNIGVLYYRLPMNADPTSMLYSSIGGPEDLDRVTERF